METKRSHGGTYTTTSRSQDQKTTRHWDSKIRETKTPRHWETETIKPRHRDSKAFFRRKKATNRYSKIEKPRHRDPRAKKPRPRTSVEFWPLCPLIFIKGGLLTTALFLHGARRFQHSRRFGSNSAVFVTRLFLRSLLHSLPGFFKKSRFSEN